MHRLTEHQICVPGAPLGQAPPASPCFLPELQPQPFLLSGRRCCCFLWRMWNSSPSQLLSKKWKDPERCKGMALNIYQQRESDGIIFVLCGKAPASSSRFNAVNLLPSLPENKLVKFCRVLLKKHSAVKWPGLEEAPHGNREEKGPVGARACHLHRTFHDCLQKLCFLIYKSCQ